MKAQGWGLAVLVAAIGCASNYDDALISPGGPPIGMPATRDYGPIVKAEHAPPPISGGTLIVTADGKLAVAADPDRDRVFVVELESKSLLHEIALRTDDEPGRLIEDGKGLVHVALRRGGAVVTIDPALGKIVARRSVCATPRGIAWEADGDRLHVACAQGELHTFAAEGDGAHRVLSLGDDLRDVVVQDGALIVSRFRSAAVLVLDRDGNEISETHLQPIGALDNLADAAVAWRMRAMPKQKRVVLVHQRGRSTPVSTQPGGYTQGSVCGGSIVTGALASIGAGGDLVQTPQLPSAVLPVDMAISPDESTIAVVSAGTWKSKEPRVLLFSGKVVAPGGEGEKTPTVDCLTIADRSPNILGQATAVAYAPNGDLITQTREPAELYIGDRAITLSNTSVEDTGHTIFHLAASFGGTVACASCHPEGGDDGRTWVFQGLGRRRTQTLRGGITQTAPFHWSGDEKNIDALMNDVFAKRMQGGVLAKEQVTALAGWLDTVPAAPKIEAVDNAAAERGKLLYARTGCSSCHAGHLLTNGKTVDVGTGAPFQVPVLEGIRFRAPYMHDGCAKTLFDRFGACGGGDAHGTTSNLSKAEIADLVAYLETL